MARIRSVKPELRTSLTVASWSRDVRYLWVLLWGYLDDHGRGVDDPRLIKADCLPLDDDATPDVVDQWVSIIAAAGPICRYECNGRRYLHVPSWEEHQRPSHPGASRIPPCPHGDHPPTPLTAPPENLAKSSGNSPETVASPSSLSREQRAGSREQGPLCADVASAPPEPGDPPTRRARDQPGDFDRFWAAYPRREGKGNARRAWTKAIRAAPPERIIAAATQYRERPGRESRYTAHPATWLNGERWDDEPACVLAPPLPPSRPSTTDQRVAQALEAGRRLQAAYDAQHPKELTA